VASTAGNFNTLDREWRLDYVGSTEIGMAEQDKSDDEPQLTGVSEVYRGWTRLYTAMVAWPDGSVTSREIEDHGSGVAVLAYDPGRRVALLVRQFRPPLAFAGKLADLLEPVAGIVESADPEACARREAMEEAGLRIGALKKVAETWSMPGISTERIHYYLAPYAAADRISDGGGLAAEGEFIRAEEMALADIALYLASGGPVDVKLTILFQALRLERPDLFAAAPCADV
jgi:nudix-type nucleoside diphosphatase (YffH/AdpP family)